MANLTRDTASVFLGDGAGNFALATELETGARPVSVATADFNGDSRRDLAVANFGSETATIFLGKGDGTRDFNRDGRGDLAVTNRNSGTVSVFLSTRPR